MYHIPLQSLVLVGIPVAHHNIDVRLFVFFGIIPQTPEIPSVEQGQQPPSSAPAVLIATQPVVPEVNLGAGWSAAPKEQTETTAAAAVEKQR
jgi:hypothetical protein